MPTHPVTVAAYLVDAADTSTAGETAYTPATLSAWVAAIDHYHPTAGHPQPAAHEFVAATLAGIRRDYATAGDRPRGEREDPQLCAGTEGNAYGMIFSANAQAPVETTLLRLN